jgi:hypothetical protein
LDEVVDIIVKDFFIKLVGKWKLKNN